jgi:hypothetical protein
MQGRAGTTAVPPRTIRYIVAGRHLPALDGFRAVAALSVVCFHFGYDILTDGVTGFFVLSGFLITSLLLREQEVMGRVSLTSFYARRTLRIFPAYCCFVLFSLAVDNLRHREWSTGLTLSPFGYGGAPHDDWRRPRIGSPGLGLLLHRRATGAPAEASLLGASAPPRGQRAGRNRGDALVSGTGVLAAIGPLR